MPDVFINYRTGDGHATAALIERELSARFGGERVFRASKSIRPGTRYAEELLASVRGSSVLLAVVGAAWADAPQLGRRDDWVSREILEALRIGVRVVPVIEGRGTPNLRADRLPGKLAELARVQSLRLDLRNADGDLRRIGDEVADLVPALRALDAYRDAAGEPPELPAGNGPSNSVGGSAHGGVVQARDISGGHVINNPTGPVHTGSGDINQPGQWTQHFGGEPRFYGDGVNFVQGQQNGGARFEFGSRDADRKQRDADQDDER